MSEEIYKYKGKYIQVSEVEKDGQVWEKAYLSSGIIIYPINENNEVLLVEEYRPHETPQVRLKPVTGIFEPEYSIEENAQREMQEEIGFKADSVEELFQINSSGTVNNNQYYVVARGLAPSKVPNPDGEHTIRKIVPMKIDVLFHKLMNHEIPLRGAFLGIFKLYHQA